MTFHYLATPYSKYPAGREAAYQDAASQAALLMEAGVAVFCPITHSHPISSYLAPEADTHENWMRLDGHFMRAAKGLIVCKLEGWQESLGVQQEIAAFAELGKPVVYMTPGIVPDLTPTRRIIGLTGFARSGKDSAAAALVADGWTRVAFADGVREAVAALNPWASMTADPESDWIQQSRLSYMLENRGGWEGIKHEFEIRRLLQVMGTEAGRNIHGPNCWIDLAKRKIDAAPGNVVITDVRFPNEAQAIRDWGGIVARIERPGVGPANDHASERLDFAADVTIHNDGTLDDLHNSVRTLLVEETV